MNPKFAQIKSLYQAGFTQRQIAAQFGVTHQRISQILTKIGVRRSEGGISVQPPFISLLQYRSDERCRQKWGVSLSTRREILRDYGHWPFLAYGDHRYNASRRSIPFLLTFDQWWTLWMQSGKWALRGRRPGYHGYVMARAGDKGPYTLGNVRVTTQSDNMVEHGALRQHR